MRTYDVTAEFYDLLQGTEQLAVAERLLDRWLGTPRIGVVEVGAGTGLATGLLARRCEVTVHAVEPAASMRAIMLSRLAGHFELLRHVRVHARPVQQLGLTDVADFALCLNTMSTLDPESRADALQALAAALVDGAVLVVQAPAAEPATTRYDLPSWQLGGDTYGGDVTVTPTGADRVEWRFTYRVRRSDVLVREQVETFDGYTVSADGFAAELTSAGFAPFAVDEPDVVIARRRHPAS